MNTAFPRHLVETLWPVPIGLAAGYLAPKMVSTEALVLIVGGALAVMVTLMVRMMLLVRRMRMIVWYSLRRAELASLYQHKSLEEVLQDISLLMQLAVFKQRLEQLERDRR